MRALVYHGAGQKSWDEVPDPRIQDDLDAVVGIEAVTICGTDLHILRGDVPEVTPGRILGHEAIGVVEAVGRGVRTVQPGDRVLISCITGCGLCRFCREGRYGQCLGGGGWVLGHLIDGTQAEYVRVPFADTALHQLPASVPAAAAVMLADILPTSYEVGVLAGTVRPGDTVAIVGAGPIGLAAVMTAKLYSPSRIIVIDPVPARLDAAKALGADVLIANGPGQPDPLGLVEDLTDGMGVDVVMEAVGIPATFELCTSLVRPGGHVANIGVHGKPATLHLEELWIRNVTITTGLVDAFSTPVLLRLITSGQIDPSGLVTHRFTMDEFERAYDVFGNAADTGALKVVITAPRS
jgi:alcohol dehydrogenase